MGRRKSVVARRTKSNARSVVHSDEEADRDEDPNPLSRDYVYDEIDEFHANREKVLVEGGGRLAARSDDQSDNEQEEVYALSGEDSLDEEDDDDDDDVNDTNLAYFEALANKDRDDLASDLEDQEDAGLPNVKAWGADKSTFYNTDFVDNDRGYFKDYEVRLADAEEKEAMDMQKRLLEQLDDDDFGMELLQKAKTMQSDLEDGSKIERDISGMSKSEKLEVIRRESPELMNLLEDFRAKLLEIKNVVQPLIDLIDEKKIPPGPGADYLHLKHQLLLNYCTNVCFYVTLKADRADTNNHPIIKRLVGYRKLMKELQTVDVLMADQIAAILNFARSGKDVSKLFKETVNANVAVPESRKQANSHLKRKDVVDDAGDMDLDSSMAGSTSVKEQLVHDPMLTTDESEALNMYSLMKAGRDRNQPDVDDESVDDDDDGDHEADRITNEQDVDFVGKRKITAQIEKNKGLTPYRKKDRRNPRVNNRNKYRKAKIRRKGQVQDVRRELKKYRGEISGIRIGTSRSTKLH